MKFINVSCVFEMAASSHVVWPLGSTFAAHFHLVSCVRRELVNSVIDINSNHRLQPHCQQSTRPVISAMCELKPVIYGILWIVLYAVCLYRVYQPFDTLPYSLLL